MIYQIAIDGPSGSGKSTIAKQLAKELGIIYVDTGAMYRAVGLFCSRKNILLDDENKINDSLDDINIELKFENGAQVILLNGEDVTLAVRTAEAGMGASAVAVFGKVREKLVGMQKKIAENVSVIMDGRDIGTVVLPNATVKIYLDASVDARTERRVNELIQLGHTPDSDKIRKEIIDRDYNDMNRAINPLRKADDAIVIDSSYMSVEQVKSEIVKILNKVIN